MTTTQQPLEKDSISLDITADVLLCHVKEIAARKAMDVHYGTSSQPYGTMSTISVTGNGFEIILVNPESVREFRLSLFEEEGRTINQKMARQVYREFKAALIGPVSSACARATRA